MKKALIFSLLGLLVLPLVLCGCGAADKASAQEIADRVMVAYPNVDSYKIDMTMTTTMDIQTNAVQMEIDMTADGVASINNSSQEMQMTMSMIADVPGIGKQNMSQEIFVVDGQMYMKMSVLGVDQWTKMDVSDELWTSQNQLKQQVEFLENAADITKIDEEDVDGIECYVLRIEPDLASLFDWVLSQQQGLSSELDLGGTDFAKMFKDFSLTEWVAKDSSLPLKAVIQVTMEILPEDMGASDDETGKISVDLQAQVRFYDYGKPVVIELPQEALNA